MYKNKSTIFQAKLEKNIQDDQIQKLGNRLCFLKLQNEKMDSQIKNKYLKLQELNNINEFKEINDYKLKQYKSQRQLLELDQQTLANQQRQMTQDNIKQSKQQSLFLKKNMHSLRSLECKDNEQQLQTSNENRIGSNQQKALFVKQLVNQNSEKVQSFWGQKYQQFNQQKINQKNQYIQETKNQELILNQLINNESNYLMKLQKSEKTIQDLNSFIQKARKNRHSLDLIDFSTNKIN